MDCSGWTSFANSSTSTFTYPHCSSSSNGHAHHNVAMDTADAQARQQALVDGLKREGSLHSSLVEAAFRAVPRHFFLPGMPLDVVYRDDAIITKRQEGRGVS